MRRRAVDQQLRELPSVTRVELRSHEGAQPPRNACEVGAAWSASAGRSEDRKP